jgi:hypothetical protein
MDDAASGRFDPFATPSRNGGSLRIAVKLIGKPCGTLGEWRLDERRTKSEHQAWTIATASLSILSLWSVSPVASARGPALIGWRASPPSSAGDHLARPH